MIRLTFRGHNLPEGIKSTPMYFVSIPRAGEFIQFSPEHFAEVESVHYQPVYEGAVLVIRMVSPAVYDVHFGVE